MQVVVGNDLGVIATAVESDVDGADKSAPSPIEDPNFHTVRTEGLESIRYLREWMATGYDTVPGSPGRAMIDRIVEHYSAAQDALKEMEGGN